MKRKLGIILALSVTFTTLTACGSKNENSISDVPVSISATTITSENKTETQTETAQAKQTTETQASQTSLTIDTESVTTSEVTQSGTLSKESDTEAVKYSEITMPVPFENQGGDRNASFYSTVNLKLGYIDMQFINLVDYDEFNNWINSTSSSLTDNTSISELANLYSFIKHFEISDDVVREILVNSRVGLEDDFSDEEIDLLLSGDDKAIAEYFAADTAINKDENLYSLKWVYYHSQQDYELNNITPQEIEATLPMFEELYITDEAEQAIIMKINSYADLN